MPVFRPSLPPARYIVYMGANLGWSLTLLKGFNLPSNGFVCIRAFLLYLLLYTSIVVAIFFTQLFNLEFHAVSRIFFHRVMYIKIQKRWSCYHYKPSHVALPLGEKIQTKEIFLFIRNTPHCWEKNYHIIIIKMKYTTTCTFFEKEK